MPQCNPGIWGRDITATDHLVIRTTRGRLLLGRTASFPMPVRHAAMLGERHALATLARDHGALGQIRHWPGRRDLHCEIRGLNDHDLLRVVEQDVASHRLLIVEVADAVTTVHVPPPPPGRRAMATPPGANLTPAQEKDAAVAAMDSMDKVLAALQRSGKYMGPALGNAFAQLFTADNLKILAAFIIAGAIANTNPVSAAVFDSAMLIMVYYQAGTAGIHALELLVRTTMAVLGAKGDADLDRAGAKYAEAFVGLGGAIFLAWLARRLIKTKNPEGGSRPTTQKPVAEEPPAQRAPEPRKAYANPKNRPAYGKGQVEKVWENAKDENGNVFDPNTGEKLSWDPTKSRAGQWDMGHLPGQKYSELHQRYMNGEIDLKQFLQEYRDPANYSPESLSGNRGHLYE